MIQPNVPALALAPMEGVTDAPMREFQGSTGAFSYAVTEFIRISEYALPSRVFRRDVPELLHGAQTRTGLPVQVQLLGGDPEKLAISALAAVSAGARSIDINFGCPAPTVNRHDGGASLLKHPLRIRAIVRAVRSALPAEIPVSAKLRLGWDDIADIRENAVMAEEGGAAWLTIHARTRMQAYRPPVFWPEIGWVRENVAVPVVANGDIWTREDFLRCRDETGCDHFMIGRGALANPALPYEISRELGLWSGEIPSVDWHQLFSDFAAINASHQTRTSPRGLFRLKQWMKFAHQYGNFPYFHELKQLEAQSDFLDKLAQLTRSTSPVPTLGAPTLLSAKTS